MDLPITSTLSAVGAPSTNELARRYSRVSGAGARAYSSHAGGRHRDYRRASTELFQQPYQQRPIVRPVAPVRAGKSSVVVETTLKAGDLIDFNKDRERNALGLVTAQDGKKNVWVLESQPHGTRKLSIQPRQVLFKLPGGPFTESELVSFTAAALADAAAQKTQPIAGINALLGDAWEMAVADNITRLTLQDIAGLIMEDESPLNLFRCYRMLGQDRLYFKQILTKGVVDEPCYEPRSPAMVEAAKVLLAAEAAAREDESAWSQAVREALSKRKRSEQPTPEQWDQGRHKRRIAALKALATKDVAALPSDTLKLAQQSLALAGIIVPSASASAPPSTPGGASPLAEAATNLLVDLRAWRRHEPVAALRKDAMTPLPESLEQEAQMLLSTPPPDSCAAIRIDLTHLTSYTIDDKDTTEIDDAVCVEYLVEDSVQGSGAGVQGPGEPVDLAHVRVWSHVADPTRWLTPNSALVDAARFRTRTLYFPWGSVPMFPRSLAEGPFSLRCQQESDAISIGVTLRRDGSVAGVQVVPSRVRVVRKMTYDEADSILSRAADRRPQQEGDEGVARDLQVLRQVADVRRTYREACGAVEIPLPETKVAVDWAQLDAGRPHVTLQRLSQWESASRGMVAEMMILAGEASGRVGAEASLPLPYRNQPEPVLPLASELEGLDSVCKGYRLRRCMMKSGVSPVPLRHSGLGLDTYVQVTSPIRRWADLVAHFNLKAHLAGQPLPFSSSDIDLINLAAASDRVRELAVAERLEESYWITEYFRQRSTSKNVQQWSATVLGWHRQELMLVSALIDELGYEVIVKVDINVLPGDYLMLALLEARPVANMLRFYVTDYISQRPAQSDSLPGMEDFWVPADMVGNAGSTTGSDGVASDSEAAVTSLGSEGPDEDDEDAVVSRRNSLEGQGLVLGEEDAALSEVLGAMRLDDPILSVAP